MSDLIAEMFLTPESHQNAYDWASALLAHAMIGISLTALFSWALGAWRGAVIAILCYATLWEGGQLVLANASLLDSFVDALAFSCGAVIVAASWKRQAPGVAIPIALMAITLWRGVVQRKDKSN